jgi:type IV pilus assembly protein PilC
MQYEYAAKSPTGATTTGILAASSVQDARRQLREKGLFVLSAHPATQGRAPRNPSVKRLWRNKISKRDLATLTSQLAIMTRSGVDLATALRNLSAHTAQPRLRAVLDDILAEVMAGKPVSQALSNHESLFGRSYIAGIAAAEASGRLPEVLDRLAALLRGEMRLLSTLRGLMAYPIVLTSVSVVVVSGLTFFVLPQFAGVFEQMNLTLPVITQIIISASGELRAHWWLWGALLLLGGGGFTAWILGPKGNVAIQRLLLDMPIARNITRPLWIGRALRLMSTMLASGVPLLEGLALTKASIRNAILRDFFQKLEQEVINGRGLAQAFLSASFVPPAAAQMISTAEQTGTLATVMELMGEFYEEEGETRLRELSVVLEPLIIIALGLVVAFVVMSVMLPIFDFATAAK